MQISRETGLNIIAGTGYYVARSHPADVRMRGVDKLAFEFIRDINIGIDGSNVRSGLMGELGVSIKMTQDEEKILRAASRANLETGCPISVHITPPGREGLKALDILESEGVSLAKVNIGHLDTNSDLEYHKKVAERGCFVSYDQFGLQYDDWEQVPGPDNASSTSSMSFEFPRDSERVRFVIEMCRSGFKDRLLLSQDIGEKSDLRFYGGHGYDHILRIIIPMLRKKGLTGF